MITLTSKQTENYKDFRLNSLTTLGVDFNEISEDGLIKWIVMI